MAAFVRGLTSQTLKPLPNLDQSGFQLEITIMSLGVILIILLIIFLLGGFSGRFGGYGYGFGHGGVGVIGAILIIVVILMLMRVI